MHVGRGEVGPVLLTWADASRASLPDVDVLNRLGQQQARRFAGMDAVRGGRFLMGRWLMAQSIRELTGTADPQLMSRCAQCGGDHGAPQVLGAPVAVSVSYAGSMVAVAAVELSQAVAVGVDIERGTAADGARRLDDLEPLFDADAVPDLREWTLIEATVKADGRGLRVPPSEVRLGDRTRGALPGSRPVTMPGQQVEIEVAEVVGPDGFLVAIALGTPRRVAQHLP